ncbi:MAG: hypothetical protein AABN95_09595 [Acidobacteriota bacterium]
MTSKRNLVVIGILAATIVSVSYFALTTVSHRRTARKYEDGYSQIKVGDSKDLLLGAMGKPTRISECVYPWFADEKREAEYRSNCKELYEYELFPVSYTISLDKNGRVINKTRAVSP